MNVFVVVVNFCAASLTDLVVGALSPILCVLLLMLLSRPLLPPPTPPQQLPLPPSPLLLSITFVIVTVTVALTADDCAVCSDVHLSAGCPTHNFGVSVMLFAAVVVVVGFVHLVFGECCFALLRKAQVFHFGYSTIEFLVNLNGYDGI